MSVTEGEKILIVDDDERLRRLLERFLTEQGYRVRGVENAEQMDRVLARELFNLVVLDLMMPGEDGLSVCSRLRASNNQVPIIMLTAKGDEASRIQGLELGADDYMTKPFSLSVLLLKIEAHFRRRKNEPGTPKIHSKDIVFIPGEMRAFVKEREISLTKNELKMLSFFLQNPKQILSKTQILENVFDLEGDFVDENTIAVNIRRLREKIEDNPAAPVYIKNIRGLGYIWNQEVRQ